MLSMLSGYFLTHGVKMESHWEIGIFATRVEKRLLVLKWQSEYSLWSISGLTFADGAECIFNLRPKLELIISVKMV